MAPATVARNDAGQATIRAVRIQAPIELDGRLDEEVYAATPPIDGFIQQEPSEGAATSEATHVWVFFDDRNVYVSARCFDSQPERDVVTELRRDNNNITQNESFTVVFDTFLDRRNGLFFQTTPIGALRDQAIVDDVLNSNWNTVWDVRTAKFEGGWTAEFRIPFASLRYGDPPAKVWSSMVFRNYPRDQLYRISTSKLPREQNCFICLNEPLTGLEDLPSARSLVLTPNATVRSVTTRENDRPSRRETDRDRRSILGRPSIPAPPSDLPRGRCREPRAVRVSANSGIRSARGRIGVRRDQPP